MQHILSDAEANIYRKIISFTSKGNSDLFQVKLHWSVRQLREEGNKDGPPLHLLPQAVEG